MDPDILAWLMSGGMGPQPGAMLPGVSAPAGAPAVAPPVVAPPPVAPVAAMPPAPMVPPQSFEPTNTGNPMMMRPPEPYMSEPAQSLGAALTPAPAGGSGVPLPQPRPANAPGATPVPETGGSDALLKTLRGVQMPAAPTPQKVSTPHAPQLGKIQAGGLADLLASLGIGPQQALPGLKLPSTLGQALGGR